MAAQTNCDSTPELNKFHDIFSNLIDALIEYTSDNSALNKKLVKHKAMYDAVVVFLDGVGAKQQKIKIIETFHKQVSPFYKQVDQGSLDFVNKVDIMHTIGLSEIMNNASDETKQNMLKYVRLLVANTRLWHAKESGYAEKAAKFSADSLKAITSMVENGGNPEDLAKEIDVKGFMEMARSENFTEMMQGAMTLLQEGNPDERV